MSKWIVEYEVQAINDRGLMYTDSIKEEVEAKSVSEDGDYLFFDSSGHIVARFNRSRVIGTVENR